ncbi:MAG TPA: hypothetical protein VE967_08065 [Gemmatimonadaceae bacterium]|nr:hypothetical protein [Gemmatimonadaceae bacterium]
MRWLACALLLWGAGSAGAQTRDTTRARIDSLAARLERTEERVKVLEQQLAAESESSVKTRSRVALEFHGRAIVNAFTNNRRVNSTGDPLFVRPDDPGDPTPQGLAMQVRQSSLGLAITAPHVWGARFTGDLDVDFVGGQLPSSGGRTFPLIRMRTMRAILAWPHAELLLGQESPLVAGVNPLSLASLGTPGFVAAGNLWLWLPQARVTVERGTALRLGLQAAVLAPGTAAAVGTFDVPDFDVAERSKRPFLETRARLRWGQDDMAAEIGVGEHVGWFLTALDTLARGFASTIDAQVPITHLIEIRGEAYEGRGARALGGGAIGQLFGINAVLIRSRGMWAQVNVRPSPALVFGVGYGVDDPHDTDLAASSRLKNEAAAIHAEWRPAGPLVFGFEYRRLRTTYLPQAYANDHLNLAFGFEF